PAAVCHLSRSRVEAGPQSKSRPRRLSAATGLHSCDSGLPPSPNMVGGGGNLSATVAVDAGQGRPVWRWLTLLGFLLVVVMNYLANALPLAGRDTGEISDRFDIVLTPAGYAFSIWSIIYLALGAFVVYQLLPNQTPAR